jgi:hypothetical protein
MTVHGSDVATAAGFGGKTREMRVAEAAPKRPTDYRVIFTPWRNPAGDVLGLVDPIKADNYTLHGCKLKRGPKGRLWIAMPSIQELVDGKPTWRTVLVLHGEVRARFQERGLDALRASYPQVFAGEES